MVHLIRSRFSFRFWTAAEDISLDIFLDTKNRILPKIQNINIIERSREILSLLFLCLFSFIRILQLFSAYFNVCCIRPAGSNPRRLSYVHNTPPSLSLSISQDCPAPQTTLFCETKYINFFTYSSFSGIPSYSIIYLSFINFQDYPPVRHNRVAHPERMTTIMKGRNNK